MPIKREFILVPITLISEKGFDFEGEPLRKDFDYTKYKIIHRKKMYDCGDITGLEMELFSEKRFIMTVYLTEIHLLKI